MKPVLVFALAVVLVSVQAALLHFIGGGAFSVSLALPCVVYLGLHAGNIEGALGSAAVGYVLDLTAGGPKGLMTFLAMVLFLGCRLVGAGVDIRGRIGFAILTAIGTFLFGVGVLLLQRAVSPPDSMPGARLLPRMLLDGVLTGAASPLIAALMRRIDALFRHEEAGLLS